MTTDGNCKSCGGPLVRYKWNLVTDVVLCDNYKCQLFRTPTSGIAPISNKVTKSKQELKALKWLGGPYDQKKGNFSDLQVRLQRLQRAVRSEDEETEVP